MNHETAAKALVQCLRMSDLPSELDMQHNIAAISAALEAAYEQGRKDAMS